MMGRLVAWSADRANHIREHAVAPEQANEAVEDPNAVWLDADPKSVTGLGIRVIGYSPTRGRVLAVIVVRNTDSEDPEYVGATCFPATGRDLQLYLSQHDERNGL